jgi:phosphoserine phosphatase
MAGYLTKLVCFDLDGTVMLRPNSLQYLLAANHAPMEILADIDRREANAEVDWIAADYERARFLEGLPVAAIEEDIDRQLLTVANLDFVLETLRGRGILTVLITSGPIEVAEAVARRFAFDYCFGSEFGTSGGGDPVFTGQIIKHLGSTGKVDCLRWLCRAIGIALEDCAAVGDGDSDVDLFRAVRTSIGINCAPAVADLVQHQVLGDDLSAILPFIL